MIQIQSSFHRSASLPRHFARLRGSVFNLRPQGLNNLKNPSVFFWNLGGMGRKPGTLYINPKKFGSLQKPCAKEMITFLSCLALNQNKDDKCSRQKSLLSTCMEAQLNQYCDVAPFSAEWQKQKVLGERQFSPPEAQPGKEIGSYLFYWILRAHMFLFYRSLIDIRQQATYH
nr:uncharacterized protein LOC109150917 [Ipomoea batatas]